jgi:hypothetical protein
MKKKPAQIQFETEATGSASCHLGDDDDYHCKFAKPWFSVLEMKAAMAVCLLLYYGLGVGKEASTPDPDWRTIQKVWLPALLDLLNTVFCNIGLVWVSSSIYPRLGGGFLGHPVRKMARPHLAQLPLLQHRARVGGGGASRACGDRRKARHRRRLRGRRRVSAFLSSSRSLFRSRLARA